MAWVVPGAFLASFWSRRTGQSERRPSIRQSILLGWTGMRGVVSLAAAVALPLTVCGVGKTEKPFPNRGVIIFRRLLHHPRHARPSKPDPADGRPSPRNIRTDEDEAAEERKARLHATRAALGFLKELTDSTDAFGDAGKELLTDYEHRIMLASRPPPAMLPLMAVGIETSGQGSLRARRPRAAEPPGDRRNARQSENQHRTLSAADG